MDLTLAIVFIFLSYLLGSVPFGYLLTKQFTGKNIMDLGSGNVGSTNVRRVVGKRLALVTQLLDMAKGLIPVATYLYFTDYKQIDSDYYIYLIALASILGHDFSIFLRFDGGKGVNTTLGASVLIAPYSVFISVAIHYLVRWRFKYVSLGSIVLGISLPLIDLILHGAGHTFYYLLICMFLIILTHRSNIKRLLQNKELSF